MSQQTIFIQNVNGKLIKYSSGSQQRVSTSEIPKSEIKQEVSFEHQNSGDQSQTPSGMPRNSNSYMKYSTRKSMPATLPSHHQQSTSSTSSPMSGYKKKKNEKAGKGLRHFSMKVCQKVKEKGTTTYNEVADELVFEETESNPSGTNASFDQKNIRRRVYDALNVLMAMNIISKEKKEIKWIGLPTTSQQECEEIEMENSEIRKRIEEKEQQLKELILNHVSYRSLIERNKDLEMKGIVPSPSSAVQLPFLVINTHKKTHINCNISNDKRDYVLKFDDQFEVHNDDEILRRMGLLLGLDKGECAAEDIEKLKKLVPKSFEKYIEIYGGQSGTENDDMFEEWIENSQSSSSTNFIKTETDLDDLISEDGI